MPLPGWLCWCWEIQGGAHGFAFALALYGTYSGGVEALCLGGYSALGAQTTAPRPRVDPAILRECFNERAGRASDAPLTYTIPLHFADCSRTVTPDLFSSTFYKENLLSLNDNEWTRTVGRFLPSAYTDRLYPQRVVRRVARGTARSLAAPSQPSQRRRSPAYTWLRNMLSRLRRWI